MLIEDYRKDTALFIKRIQETRCYYNMRLGIERESSDADHVFGRGKTCYNPKEHWLNILGIHHEIHYDKHHQAVNFSMKEEVLALIERNKMVFEAAIADPRYVLRNWNGLDIDAIRISGFMFDEALNFQLDEFQKLDIWDAQYIRLAKEAKTRIYADVGVPDYAE